MELNLLRGKWHCLMISAEAVCYPDGFMWILVGVGLKSM